MKQIMGALVTTEDLTFDTIWPLLPHQQ